MKRTKCTYQNEINAPGRMLAHPLAPNPDMVSKMCCSSQNNTTVGISDGSVAVARILHIIPCMWLLLLFSMGRHANSRKTIICKCRIGQLQRWIFYYMPKHSLPSLFITAAETIKWTKGQSKTVAKKRRNKKFSAERIEKNGISVEIVCELVWILSTATIMINLLGKLKNENCIEPGEERQSGLFLRMRISLRIAFCKIRYSTALTFGVCVCYAPLKFLHFSHCARRRSLNDLLALPFFLFRFVFRCFLFSVGSSSYSLKLQRKKRATRRSRGKSKGINVLERTTAH